MSKYYLDEQGLIKVLQKVSSVINQNTSSSINVNEVTDPVTGEVTQEVQDSNKFATVGAVYNYVANQSKENLTITKQYATQSQEGYSLQTTISQYNGNNVAQINLNLVDNNDIKNLFNL